MYLIVVDYGVGNLRSIAKSLEKANFDNNLKYQIKISKYMCANYIKSFFEKDDDDLSLMAYKLKNGYNENEVILISKNIENKGFFEKFFQLFS